MYDFCIKVLVWVFIFVSFFNIVWVDKKENVVFEEVKIFIFVIIESICDIV